MSTSEISIANEALGIVARGAIQSLTQSTPEAAAVATYLESAIREVLGSHDWPYARVVKQLTAVDLTFAGWTYAYQLPATAVRLWRVASKPTVLADPTTEVEPYEINKDPDSDQTYVLSNFTPAYARFTSRGVNLAMLPPDVLELMHVKLASKLAMPLRREAKLRQSLLEEYRGKLSAAITLAANFEPEISDIDFQPEMISVRSS